MTKAGRRRAQKDADSLSKAMSKELDSTNDFQRSTKRIYLVDKQGNNRWDENGRGYFDAGAGLMKYERDKLMRKDRDAQAYLNIKNTLKQKYDDVKVDARYDIDTGKAYSKIVLSKNGEKFVSEITKDYGKFDSSKQIEFKPMFKD